MTGPRIATTALEPRRPPPEAARVLLPVWGSEFIGQFLDYSLPTLLAPGNIPALAAALPTRFVLLTRAADEPRFRAHPAFRHLAREVETEFLPIDNLITSGNHSTTITFAFARGVRALGRAMLDTCFFFLVSDYIMADGSLAAVLARMLAGASAVQAGNFQLMEETAQDWLDRRFGATGGAVAVSSRELMRWSLGCLHPLTLANTVNFPLCHNAAANRLLWRVDENTMIGRFFLLHMICIRPEIGDFFVGASCDYSFVPEMCPSGNAVTMTDSDDYFVVEIQPRWHESQFLRAGPASTAELAKSLSEWTTAGHRANARQTIIFHADEPPACLSAAIAEAERYVGEVAARLTEPPKPHRHHPYWKGALAAFDAAAARRDRDGSIAGLHRSPRPSLTSLLSWLRLNLLGLVPEVTRAHPRWVDMRAPLAACLELVRKPGTRLLIAANRTTAVTDWLRNRMPGSVFVSLRRLQRPRPVAGLTAGGFDACLIELVDNDFAEAETFFRLLLPFLQPDAQVLLVALNESWLTGSRYFGRIFAFHATNLAYSGLWPLDMHIGTASRLRWWTNGACVRLSGDLLRGQPLLLPARLLAAALVLPLALLLNMLSAARRAPPPLGSRIVTSLFIRYRAAGRG